MTTERRLQERIKELMLEYCFDELTPEELANWIAYDEKKREFERENRE